MEILPAIVVFVVWLIGDVFWGKYTVAIAKLHKWTGPLWAALITGFTMFNVDMFTKSLWYGVPAILGAVIGTHLTIRYEIWRHKRQAQILAHQALGIPSESELIIDDDFLRVMRKDSRYIQN